MPYPFAFCYTDCTRQSANSKGLTASRCLHTLSLWHAMRTHHRRVMLSAAKHPGQPGEAMLTPMGLPCVMLSGSEASGTTRRGNAHPQGPPMCHAERQQSIRATPFQHGERGCFAAAPHDTRRGLFYGMT